MSPVRMSKIEASVRVVLEFIESFNRHDLAAMLKMTSEDCVLEDTSPAPDGTRYEGREAVRGYYQNLFEEAREAHVEVEEVFGLGLRCVLRWRFTWKDEAGEAQHARGADVFKLRDGLICENLSYGKG